MLKDKLLGKVLSSSYEFSDTFNDVEIDCEKLKIFAKKLGKVKEQKEAVAEFIREICDVQISWPII